MPRVCPEKNDARDGFVRVPEVAQAPREHRHRRRQLVHVHELLDVTRGHARSPEAALLGHPVARSPRAREQRALEGREETQHHPQDVDRKVAEERPEGGVLVWKRVAHGCVHVEKWRAMRNAAESRLPRDDDAGACRAGVVVA